MQSMQGDRMNYGQILFSDIANGIGCRTSLFVSGCTHHCRECFNPMTWDFDYGELFTKEVEDRLLQSIQVSYIDGITILGGEPMEVKNQRDLLPFIRRIRKEAFGKTIWIYSGYTWEELTDPANNRCHCEDTWEFIRSIDVLVDGEFILEKKDITLRFRGSANQRIIDVAATLDKGEIVLLEDT